MRHALNARRIMAAFALPAALLSPPQAAAQAMPAAEAPGRRIEALTPLAPGLPRATTAGPAAAEAALGSRAAPPDLGEAAFRLRRVAFVADGPPPVPLARLRAEVSWLLERPVGLTELESARRALTQLLIDEGYLSSGALLPAQDVSDGVVTFRIVSGTLTAVRIGGDGIGGGGLGDLSPDYIRRRLPPEGQRPFDVDGAQERLRLLLDDRNIEALRAEVRPGARLGDAELDIVATPRRPVDLSVRLDNDAAPSVGRERATVVGAMRNLLGVGDQVVLDLEASEGAQRLRFSADAPVGDGVFAPFVFAEYGRARIVEAPLDSLDVESDTARLGAGVRAALFEDFRSAVSVDASFEVARGETRLLGEPFSFSPGAENGRTRLSLLRLGGLASVRRERATFAARSLLTVGLDVLDATTGQPADGAFVAWLGQAQVVAQATERLSVIVRAQAQLASDALPPIEQASIGGRDTVRGWRRAAQVGDRGAALSVEGRWRLVDAAIPEATPPEHDAGLIAAPFIDVGSAWRKGASDDADPLIGVGVGLIWSPVPGLALASYAAVSGGGRSSDASARRESVHVTLSAFLP
jgi:hemolysin activation/secretion protein